VTECSRPLRSSTSAAGSVCLAVGLSFVTTFAAPVPPVDAYRPFISTDAAVVDPREVEIELGYFNLDRINGRNTIVIPHVVVNYGVAKRVELVAEFRLEVSPHVDIADPGLFVKGILKEGVLQDKPGISVAVEAGPLLPSTLRDERGVGFQAVGIVSGKLDPVMMHVNGGGGVSRDGRLFGSWGVIGEVPLHSRLRLVGEVNGESVDGERPNNSALLGVIWQPTSANLFLDAGVRRGISQAAPDWQFTIGMTFGFPLPIVSRP
jgi:hypothetical protein